MATIELKVDFNGERSTKMRFPMNHTVLDVLKDIWNTKINKVEDDFGLFLPKDGNKKGKAMWLKLERTLRYYDLQPGVRPPLLRYILNTLHFPAIWASAVPLARVCLLANIHVALAFPSVSCPPMLLLKSVFLLLFILVS